MKATEQTDAPPLVIARGTPAEQGAVVGEATAEQILVALSLYERRFRDEAGLDDEGRRRRGASYREIIHSYSPRTAQLIDAMADSVDVDRTDLHLLNARSEVLYGSARPMREVDGACTTAAVLGTHTADGDTYVLENWDWRENLHGQMYTLATEDEDGHRIFSLAEAGMVAKAGMSSAGVAVALNLLASDRNMQVPGVPIHIILREILQQRRFSRAIATALQADREGSANILLASDEGDAIDLELVADDFNYILPAGGILTHANHFQVRGPWKDTFVSQSAFTLLRDTRLRRALELDGGRITIEAMHRGLADHASFPDSVCRHADPDFDTDLRVATLGSMVMNVSTQTVRVTAQSPCEGKYVTYELKSLFDGHAPPGSDNTGDGTAAATRTTTETATAHPRKTP